MRETRKNKGKILKEGLVNINEELPLFRSDEMRK